MSSSSSATSGGIGAVGVWVLFWWGDPDLADAIMAWLFASARHLGVLANAVQAAAQ